MMDPKEFLRVFTAYEVRFNEGVLVGLPEDKDPEELYEIMVKCLKVGKDAVELGYSDGYAGYIKDGNGEEYYA